MCLYDIENCKKDDTLWTRSSLCSIGEISPPGYVEPTIKNFFKWYVGKERGLKPAYKVIDIRQKRYSLEQKAEFIAYMCGRAQDEEKRDNLSGYAERHGVSRQTLYNLHNKFNETFDEGRPGPKKLERTGSGEKFQEEEPDRLDEAREEVARKLQEELRKRNEECETLKKVLETLEEEQQTRLISTILEAAVCPVSAWQIRKIIKTAFGIKISKSKIRRIIREYSRKARKIIKDIGVEKFVKSLAVDEVFAGRKPILTGVDLDSFAVVICEKEDNRTHQVWHTVLSLFPCLKLVVSDRAKGIIKAVYLCGDVRHQYDLFHFKRDVGRYLRHLEGRAYHKIDREYKAQDEEAKSKTEQEKAQRHQVYLDRRQEAAEAIDIFDLAEKAFKSIFKAMDLFDDNGGFQDIERSFKQIERNRKKLEQIAERMPKNSRDRKKMSNLTKQVQDPHLLLYLSQLQNRLLDIILRWNTDLPAMPRKKVFAILAEHWYWSRNHKKKKHLASCQKQLAIAFQVVYLKKTLANFKEVFEKVTQALDQAHRASSLVESYNSQVRIYQQVKKEIGGDFLYLVVLKWNMTKFEAGKRKGQSPYEILGVSLEHDNWIDLLLKP